MFINTIRRWTRRKELRVLLNGFPKKDTNLYYKISGSQTKPGVSSWISFFQIYNEPYENLNHKYIWIQVIHFDETEKSFFHTYFVFYISDCATQKYEKLTKIECTSDTYDIDLLQFSTDPYDNKMLGSLYGSYKSWYSRKINHSGVSDIEISDHINIFTGKSRWHRLIQTIDSSYDIQYLKSICKDEHDNFDEFGCICKFQIVKGHKVENVSYTSFTTE